MIEEVINNPSLTKYLATFQSDEVIFTEGDDSQDLYVLVSGQVDIIKGEQKKEQKIRVISEKGSIFGEVSFFLGSCRTASARARNDVQVIQIPKENIELFLHNFPDAGREISKRLAQWLCETSQVLFGFKEFCNKLPDAVILTGREGKVIGWNSAAEELYGQDWNHMRYTNVGEIYVEPEVYRDFLEEVKREYEVREKIFKINHPKDGVRAISTSFTILYDGHYNFQGVLSIGRDVTETQKLKSKIKRTNSWIIAAFFLIVATAVVGYLSFFKPTFDPDSKHQEFKNRLARDHRRLQSSLAEHSDSKIEQIVHQELNELLKEREDDPVPYSGLVLLNSDWKVRNAYFISDAGDAATLKDTDYAARLKFMGSESSLHRVRTYHANNKVWVEIAFKLHKDNKIQGWLVFQMDMEALSTNYGIDKERLINFQFDKP